MSDHKEAGRTGPNATAIRELLNQWDFIGVVADGILDEYDCLIGPISSRLQRGETADELHAFLAAELSDHFGLGGSRTPARERFVEAVMRLG